MAVAELRGPEAARQIVDRLDLENHQYFHSARAELLRRPGRTEDARHAYQRALRWPGHRTSSGSCGSAWLSSELDWFLQ